MTDRDKAGNKIHKKAYIYGIHTNNSKDMYVGSTTKSLEHRLKNHEWRYKRYLKDDTEKYISSYEVLKQGDYYIELIDELDNVSKEDIYKTEGYYIKLFRCVNQTVAGRKPEEYREENRELIREKQEKYFYKVQSGEHVVKPITEGKITCGCGCEYLKCNEKRHMNSKIHNFALKYGSLTLEELIARVDLDASLQGELLKKKRAIQCK